jgi:hypothetical protein
MACLQHIFGYVGAGHWLFLAKVSKRWKRLYSEVSSVDLQPSHHGWERTVRCCSKQTLGSAVFANTNTIRISYDCGLELGDAADTTSRSLRQRWLLMRAGQSADISTLQLAHSLGMPWLKEVAIGVAQSKCLAKLQWLYPQLHATSDNDTGSYDFDDSSEDDSDTENARPAKIRGWRSADLLSSAAAHGAVDIVQWLLELGVAVGDSVYDAARTGQLNVLQFLYKKGCKSEDILCHWAARRADLVMLQRLHAHACSWGDLDEFTGAAASSGSTEVLAWLQQHGAVSFSGAVMCAAAGSVAADDETIALCAWLRAQGCPWDESATAAAAGDDKFDTLKWLCEHGCPCDMSSFKGSTAVEAACSGSAEMLQYCVEQGAVWSVEQLTALLQAAGCTDNIATAKWLRHCGAEWPAVLKHDYTQWHAAMLEWARAEGCTSPVEPADAE